MGQETITLTEKELKKVKVLEKLMDKQITTEEAANLLGLSKRQVLRLKATYKQEGDKGIGHKNRGKKPNHTISDETRGKIVNFYIQKYKGCNNVHFSELLEENEGIQVSSSSVRRILLEAKVIKEKQKRRPKAHRPRERKAQAGMLWQMDASPHDWLEGRGPKMSLHGAIDDATGDVVGAIFQEEETLSGYFEVMHQGITKYGIPLAIYSDRHAIFRSPKEDITIEQELSGETQPLTNFGKAMQDLEIEHIKARSPQAKGRVERLWGTLQDRLIIELRIRNVTTMEEANKVLPQLIQKHNKRFAVKPEEQESAYRKLKEDQTLKHLFCIRVHRKMGNGQTFSYAGKIYTLDTGTQRLVIQSKTQIEVRQTMQGELFVWYKENIYSLRETPKIERPVENKKKAESSQSRKPAADHPWKTWKGPKEKDFKNKATQPKDSRMS